MKFMYDNFMIYGKNKEEHNIALARVLPRTEDCGLTFSAKKCELNQKQVNYFGLLFAEEGVDTAMRAEAATLWQRRKKTS